MYQYYITFFKGCKELIPEKKIIVLVHLKYKIFLAKLNLSFFFLKKKYETHPKN